MFFCQFCHDFRFPVTSNYLLENWEKARVGGRGACLIWWKSNWKPHSSWVAFCTMRMPNFNRNSGFQVFYAELILSNFKTTFIFCSRREKSLALLVGISAMNLMIVTGNALYWTSTFTVKKERFPGMHWFTSLVSMSTWSDVQLSTTRLLVLHLPGLYQDGVLPSVWWGWWWLLIFPLRR